MQPINRNGGFVGTASDFSLDEANVNSYKTISYVGGTTSSYFGTANHAVSLTGLTGGIASAPAAGDLVIIAVGIASTAQITDRITGYTQFTSLYANDSYDVTLQVGYKVMTSTPDTSITITGGSGSATNGMAIAVQVWRNVDTNSPFDVVNAVAAINTAVANPGLVSLTLPGSRVVVIGAAAHIAGAVNFTAPSLTAFLANNSNANYDASVGMGYMSGVVGTNDPAAFTFGGTDSTSYSYATYTIGLTPALNVLNNRNTGIWDNPAVYRSRVGT